MKPREETQVSVKKRKNEVIRAWILQRLPFLPDCMTVQEIIKTASEEDILWITTEYGNVSTTISSHLAQMRKTDIVRRRFIKVGERFTGYQMFPIHRAFWFRMSPLVIPRGMDKFPTRNDGI